MTDNLEEIPPNERVNRRGFCFTLFNYTDELKQKIRQLLPVYLVYGHETCPTTGKAHLQGYIYFKNARSSKSLYKLVPGWAVYKCKGTVEENYTYCTKGTDIYEEGTKPATHFEKGIRGGAAECERWDNARTAARDGRFDDIDSDLYIRYQNSFKRLRTEDGPQPPDLESRQTYGVWIYGPPRTGKSHYVRTNYPNCYLKDINKWWDGYQGEPVVLIDEITPDHASFMMPLLKKWVDKWKFSAEFKGGRKVIRPENVFVTSNHSIEEVFPPGIDRDALVSRFEVIYKDKI
jgi:ssDNA-binding Zn-finger/Zn-ribbon topoisomerase 1